MNDPIVLDHVSKDFKRSNLSHHTTLKDMVLKGQLFRMWKAADRVEALSDVSLSIPRGTVMGVIGPNGAGKSTLLRLIAGIYRPSRGTITVAGRVSALLNLGLGFHPEFTGRENIAVSGLALGLSHKQVAQITDEVISFAELEAFIDSPMRTYSSGMSMRLAFSIAANVNPDILLLDEVLSVGDARFSAKSRERMDAFKRQGKTILFVTHDLTAVEGWCHAALLLVGGRVQTFGEPRAVVAKYLDMAAQ